MLKTYRIIPLVFILFLFVFFVSINSSAAKGTHGDARTNSILGKIIKKGIAANHHSYEGLKEAAIGKDGAGKITKVSGNLDEITAIQKGIKDGTITTQDLSDKLREVLIEYSGKSEEIETIAAGFQTATKIYDLGQTGIKDGFAGAIPTSINITMGSAESALDVVSLRCQADPSDNKLIDRLKKVGGLEGQFNNYQKKREKVCNAVKKIYELREKIKSLEDIRTNGYSIMYKSVHNKKLKFPKKRKRHISTSVHVKYYPDIQENYATGTLGTPEFSIDNDESYFKWSSNEKKYLYDILNAEAIPEASVCGDNKPFWFKISGRIFFRLKQKNASEGKVDISACARFKAYKRTKNIQIYSGTIPAPFGYLEQVTEMKDSLKQSAMNSLTKNMAEMLGIDDKLNDLSTKKGAVEASIKAAEAAAQAAKQKAEELAKQAAEAAQLAEQKAAEQAAKQAAKQAAEAAAQAAQQKAEELAKQAAEALAQAAQQKAEELAKQAAAQAQKDMAASPGQATTGSPNVAPGMAPPPGPPGMPPTMAPPIGDPAMAPPMGDPCMAVPAGPDRDACYATAPAPGMAPPTGDPAVAPQAGQ